MSQIEANCPHCGTSFTVSDDQLRAANGHVRCGVCMKVFKAAEPVEAPAPAPGPGPAPAVQDNFGLDDDSSIEEWIKKNQKTGNSNIQSGPVTAPENIQKESLSFEDEFSDAFEELTSTPVDDAPAPKQTKEPPQQQTTAKKESHAVEQAEEDELSELLTRGRDPVHQTETGNRKNESSNDGFGISLDDLDDDMFGFGDSEPVAQVALGSREIEELPTLENSLPSFLWVALTLAFSLALFAQVLIKNFDELAIDPEYRSLYATFCSAGLCTLPPLKDVSLIRGSNLVVRPHPNQPGALIIDAMINNQAPYDQDFPILYLSFSNLQGKVIASRAFKPKDYLQGELRGLSNLPSKTPLHISLELVDPGVEAVNYNIDFMDNS